MADKSNRLIRDALSRAAAEPNGYALLAGRSEPGLFPATALARGMAERAKSDGYLQVVRTETHGKQAREICVLTDKGRDYLTHQSNPRDVLEDLVRVLESRQSDVETLSSSVQQMRQSLQGIRSTVEAILPRLTPPLNGTTHHGSHMNGSTALLSRPAASNAETLVAEVKAKLAEWHAAGASEDCPLPELFNRLECGERLTIGRFHDCLRQLYDEQIIYLHPWTGPLYALPEPAYALLIGHEIAYYASVR